MCAAGYRTNDRLITTLIAETSSVKEIIIIHNAVTQNNSFIKIFLLNVHVKQMRSCWDGIS